MSNMKAIILDDFLFDPTQYIAKDEVLRMIYDLKKDDFPLVEIGVQEITEETKVIIPFMEEWTYRIDQVLEKIEVDSPLHSRLFEERGCTFDEYKDLFNVGVDEDEYSHFPAYDFFAYHTIDKFTLWNFLHGKEANEENYIRDILKAKLTAINYFFNELHAFLPYKNLKRHAYISGKSGSGKSELMKLIVYGIQKEVRIQIRPHW